MKTPLTAALALALALALFAGPAAGLPNDISFGTITSNTSTTGGSDFIRGCAVFHAWGTWWTTSPSAALEYSPDGGTTWLAVLGPDGTALALSENSGKSFCWVAAPLRVTTTGSTGSISIAAEVQYLSKTASVGLGGGSSLASGGTVSGELIVDNSVNPLQTWQLASSDVAEMKVSSGQAYLQSSTGTMIVGAAASPLHITGTGVGFGAAAATTIDVGAGAQTFSEMTPPGAPAADGAVLYVDDSGGGKTRLMVRFNTGAVQQIAIEP